MKKVLHIAALFFSAVSIFFQYKTISFASTIPDRVREFGRVLVNGEESEKVTEFFFYQADEIHTAALDSFITQQISMGFLTASIICLGLGFFIDGKTSKTSSEKTATDSQSGD